MVFTFNEGMANTIALTQLLNAKVNIGGPEWDELSETEKADWHNAKAPARTSSPTMYPTTP